MMEQSRTRRLRPIPTMVWVVVIALISLLGYEETLRNHFNVNEDLRLIEDGRIDSIQDLWEIFTSPLFGRVEHFPPGLRYYRPVTALTFGLDYAVWGLNPFGFHLTNLMLHILVSLLIFFIARRLFSAEQIIPWVAAVTFAIHPILEPNVALITNRQDILAVLFMLLSLILFTQSYRADNWRKMLRVSSVLLYTAALLSKEVAFIFPGIIIAYLALFPLASTDPFQRRVWQSIRGCVPFLAVTATALIWRTYVLGGNQGLLGPGLSTLLIPAKYVVALVFPPGSRALTLFPSAWQRMGSVALLAILGLLIVFLVWFYRRQLFDLAGYQKASASKLWVPFGLMTLMVLSGIGLLAYVAAAPYSNEVIQGATYQNKPGFLGALLEGRQGTPAAAYLLGPRDRVLTVLLGALIASACCWTAWKRFTSKEAEKERRVLLFVLVWLALPLALYWLTLQDLQHQMYAPAVPFALALSAIMVKEIEDALRPVLRNHGRSHGWRRLSIMSRFSHLATYQRLRTSVIVGIWVVLLVLSPLVRDRSQMEIDGKIARMFYQQLDEVTDKLPHDITIFFDNVPLVHSNFIEGKTIESWLNLRYPRNTIRIVIVNNVEISALPKDLRLASRVINERTVAIQTIVVYR
jgi:hypothetical protein